MAREHPHYDPPNAAPASNHGKTAAGWALFWSTIAGALCIAFAITLWQPWLAIVGGVLIVLGLIAAKIMRHMGLGQPIPPSAAQEGRTDWYA